MLIDVNKWIDKNGSFDEAGGLDLVRHGYEWIRQMITGYGWTMPGITETKI